MVISSNRQEASRHVTVLGSTGSIGQNTLKVLELSEEAFSVTALTAHSNVGVLVEQAIRLRPRYVATADESLYSPSKQALSGTGIAVAAGDEAVCEAAAMQSDWVMSAIVGAVGLRPTFEAIRRGAAVALANKECLVCAGDLMMEEVKRCGATLIPVDSEHSAIAQSLRGSRPSEISHVTLTASGGPFRNWSHEQMRLATPEQALKHPNWSMGAKITIDSATMMNKGLELIEAYHLFPVSPEQIKIVVHPESVIHGMVQYQDGSVIAQMGAPDMMTPIAVALSWPDRLLLPQEPLDFIGLGKLTFEAVDEKRFPAVGVARRAISKGGAVPLVMNAANEVAVMAFLEHQIAFTDIVSVVEQVVEVMKPVVPASLDEVLFVDKEVRQFTLKYLEKYRKNAA